MKQIVLGNLSYPHSSHRERSDHFVLYDSSFDIPLICIGDLGLYMYVEFVRNLNCALFEIDRNVVELF